VYPEGVSNVVLIAAAPTCVRNAAVMSAFRDIGSTSFQDPISANFLKSWLSSPNPIPPDFFARLPEETAKAPARVWKAAIRGLLTDDHSAFLHNITAPTLIIWGDEDNVFMRADQDALCKAIRGAVFKVYAGAGHNVHWETGRSVQVAADIRAFVIQDESP